MLLPTLQLGAQRVFGREAAEDVAGADEQHAIDCTVAPHATPLLKWKNDHALPFTMRRSSICRSFA
jgi:hypothetical protein